MGNGSQPTNAQHDQGEGSAATQLGHFTAGGDLPSMGTGSQPTNAASSSDILQDQQLEPELLTRLPQSIGVTWNQFLYWETHKGEDFWQMMDEDLFYALNTCLRSPPGTRNITIQRQNKGKGGQPNMYVVDFDAKPFTQRNVKTVMIREIKPAAVYAAEITVENAAIVPGSQPTGDAWQEVLQWQYKDDCGWKNVGFLNNRELLHILLTEGILPTNHRVKHEYKHHKSNVVCDTRYIAAND